MRRFENKLTEKKKMVNKRRMRYSNRKQKRTGREFQSAETRNQENKNPIFCKFLIFFFLLL